MVIHNNCIARESIPGANDLASNSPSLTLVLTPHHSH